MKFLARVLPLLGVILFLILGQFHPVDDLSRDLSQQLLVGKTILATHQLIKTNTFSYTNTGFPYINYEWLVEISFYLITTTVGLFGLYLIKIITASAAFILLLYFCYKKYPPLFISFLALPYLLIFLDRNPLRPEFISYLLTTSTVVMLYKFRDSFTKYIYILIPLQLLWINCHLYFVIGLFLQFLFILEGLIVFPQKYSGQYIKTLTLVFLASVAISLLNPYGINGLIYPFQLFQNYGLPIQENLGVFAVESLHPKTLILSLLIFKLISLALGVLFYVFKKKARLIDFFLVISFVIFSLIATRNVQLFVLLTFIPACHLFFLLYQKYFGKISQKISYFQPLTLGIFFLCLILSFQYEISQHGLGYGLIIKGENLLNFIQTHHISGPYFNDYDSGDYLEYRLYPDQKVFVDGRPEAFPASFFADVYIPLLKNYQVFQQTDQQYKFNAVILSTNDLDEYQLIANLNKDASWKLVYLDQYYCLFLKNILTNKFILDSYAITEDSYQIVPNQSFSDLASLGYFFYNIGWKKPLLQIYQQMHYLKPQDCPTLNNLIFILGKDSAQSAIYIGKYLDNCQGK